MAKSHKFLAFLGYLLLVSSFGGYLHAQSGIFDRIGIIPGHGTYSSLPIESVDLFTGNLTLAYRDIYLPGPNGLNVEVWRVYNSKILKDRQSGQAASVQAYHKSWVGIGWTMLWEWSISTAQILPSLSSQTEGAKQHFQTITASANT